MLHVKEDFRLQVSNFNAWSSIHGSEIDWRRPLPCVTDCKKMFNSFFTHQIKIKSKTHQFDQKSGILSSRRQLDASATLNLHPAIAEDISGVVSHYVLAILSSLFSLWTANCSFLAKKIVVVFSQISTVPAGFSDRYPSTGLWSLKPMAVAKHEGLTLGKGGSEKSIWKIFYRAVLEHGLRTSWSSWLFGGGTLEGR